MTFDLWQLGHQLGQPSGVHDIPTWKRPESGWVKLNIDAAFLWKANKGPPCVLLEMNGVSSKLAKLLGMRELFDACSMEAVAC